MVRHGVSSSFSLPKTPSTSRDRDLPQGLDSTSGSPTIGSGWDFREGQAWRETSEASSAAMSMRVCFMG